jgi:hypothetical protein
MDMLFLNKERISRLCGYYSHRFTDDDLKRSVKIRDGAGVFVVFLVSVDLYFEDPNEDLLFRKRHIYFGDLNACSGDLQDLVKEMVTKVSKIPYKITLIPCIDHFDIDINFLWRKVKEK